MSSHMQKELIEESTATITRCQEFQHHSELKGIFALTTALRLQGIILPRILGAHKKRLDKDNLVVHVGRRNLRTSLPNISTIYQDIPIEIVDIAPGVVCTSPVCTWYMMAAYIDYEELIVLGDALMYRNTLHPKCAIEDFEDYLNRVEAFAKNRDDKPRNPRNIKQCRRALRQMRPNRDSPQETRLYLSIRRHRLPEFEANYPIEVPNLGIIHVDMVHPESKTLLEYDGSFHKEQWKHDNIRRNHLESCGWTYVQIMADSLASEAAQQRMADRIADVIAHKTGVLYQTHPVLSTYQVGDKRRTIERPRKLRGWKQSEQ